MDQLITEVICSRCNRPPQNSYVSGLAFVTYICYEDCGNIFWTLRKCENCKVINFTKIVNKPKNGEPIKCKKCEFQCYYLRCPYEECRGLMFMQSSMYKMGQCTSCTVCHNKFKLIICSCGGLLYKKPEQVIFEGVKQYPCKQCQKKIIYTSCPACRRVDYYFELQEIGQKIKCSHCRQIRYFIPCPDCGQSIISDNFAFGEKNKCNYCHCVFEFAMCINCCLMNFYGGRDFQSSYRTCKRGCNKIFIVINCNKCKYPLYFQNYDYGYAREEQCPSCKSQIKFHLCQCGILTKNGNRCPKMTCSLPKGIKNYSKEWRLQMEKNMIKHSKIKHGENGQYNAQQCKICFDDNSKSCMVNQSCRHMMMCQSCYRIQKTAQRNNQIVKCPVCRQPGIYHKYVQPILQ